MTSRSPAPGARAERCGGDAGGAGSPDPARRIGPPSSLRGLLGDVGWALLIAMILTVLLIPLWGSGWRRIALGFAVNATVTLGIGLSLANLYGRLYPALRRRWPGTLQKLLIHGVLLATGVGVGGEVAIRVLQLTLGIEPSDLRPSVLRIGLVVAVIVVALSIGFERLRERAREVELREQEARQRELRARLEALQARTDPHFLFNSLNTVAGLIEEDPARAERALEKLSGLYRYTLQGSSSRWVKLAEELGAVRDYLEMEALRFGDRLRWSIEASEEAGTTLVPPLLVQPLVENAVLHGVAPRREGGSVSVRAQRRGEALELQVEDDGPGPGGSSYRGAGTALETLRDRLRLLYEEGASLETVAAGSGGFLATLRLPGAGGEETS